MSSDLLARSAEEILAEILHAAAHAIGDARGVATLSRQGRYHPERFAEVARGVGLAPERDERQGWASTSLAVGTSVTYATELRKLRELVQTLPRRQAEPSGRRSSNNGLVDSGTSIRHHPGRFFGHRQWRSVAESQLVGAEDRHLNLVPA